MELNQDDMISHFHDLTGIEDLNKCRTILSNHDWNLEQAINTVLSEEDMPSGLREDFEPLNSHFTNSLMNRLSANFHSNMSPPQSPTYYNFVHNLFHLSSPITPINNSYTGWQKLVYNLLTFPLKILYYTMMTFFKFFTSMFQFSALTDSQHPDDEVSEFISSFESKYGPHHPPFYLSSYGKALNDAKNGIKFMLVYLHDQSHPDTTPFCGRVLCSTQLLSYLTPPTTSSSSDSPAPNWLVWGCHATSAEGRRVGNALNLTNPHGPTLAVVGLKSFVGEARFWLPSEGQNTTSGSRPIMTLLGRWKGLDDIVGPALARQLRTMPDDTAKVSIPNGSGSGSIASNIEQQAVQHFIRQLNTLVEINQQGPRMAMQEKMLREHTKTLREQQDEAYKESLKADKQKIEQKRLDRLHKHKAEVEKAFGSRRDILMKEALNDLKIELANLIKPEPHPDANDKIKVIIKLPTGKRLERTFHPNSFLQDLYYFVFCHPDSSSNFTLATHYPRTTLPCQLETEHKKRVWRDVEKRLLAENEEYAEMINQLKFGDCEDVDQISFKDYGLRNNTMLYVQDIEDD